MDTDKANKYLVPYMMHILEKKSNKKFKYSLKMASDALKHAEFMGNEGKVLKTPEHLLYCSEIVSTATVPSRYVKFGVFNIINNLFRYEKDKQKIINSDEIGIGVYVKEDKGVSEIYVTQRLR